MIIFLVLQLTNLYFLLWSVCFEVTLQVSGILFLESDLCSSILLSCPPLLNSRILPLSFHGRNLWVPLFPITAASCQPHFTSCRNSAAWVRTRSSCQTVCRESQWCFTWGRAADRGRKQPSWRHPEASGAGYWEACQRGKRYDQKSCCLVPPPLGVRAAVGCPDLRLQRQWGSVSWEQTSVITVIPVKATFLQEGINHFLLTWITSPSPEFTLLLTLRMTFGSQRWDKSRRTWSC